MIAFCCNCIFEEAKYKVSFKLTYNGFKCIFREEKTDFGSIRETPSNVEYMPTEPDFPAS